MDAAPFILKISNCRKNNTCCNRKHPTFLAFLIFFDNGSTIENQVIHGQNGNQIFLNNSYALRIDVLMVYVEHTGLFLIILYEVLIGCKKNKMKK